MQTFERLHVYANGTLAFVCPNDEAILAQALSEIPSTNIVIKKIVETHSYLTVFGLPDSPPLPSPPQKPVTLKRTVVNHTFIDAT